MRHPGQVGLITYGRYETRAEKSPTTRARGGRIAEERSLLESSKRHGVQAAGAHICTAQEEFQFPKRSPTICVCSVLCLEAALIPTPTPNCMPCLVSNCRSSLTAGGGELKQKLYQLPGNATQLPQSKTAETQFSKQDGELKHKFILTP